MSTDETRDDTATTPEFPDASLTAGLEPAPESTSDTTPETASETTPTTPQRAPLTREEKVAAAVTGWRRELAALGGPNSLLWFDDPGAIELTTAHPGGVARLLAGHPTRLAELVREPGAFAEAAAAAHRIAEHAADLHDRVSIPSVFLAMGMASWELPGVPRTPQAPVLLRPVTLRPAAESDPHALRGPHARQDLELDLGSQLDVNPALLHYLSAEHGIDVSAWDLIDRATNHNGFDPYPAYAALAAQCASIPGFEVTPRLLLATFSWTKLDAVADLAGRTDDLARHDIIAALAGDEPAAARAAQGLIEPPADPEPAHERLILDVDADQQAVLESAREAGCLAVLAPAGTGATQTIANLAGVNAGKGRSTLVVAANALDGDDLIARLAEAGFGHRVLDTRTASVDRLGAVRALLKAIDRPDQGGDSEQVNDAEDYDGHEYDGASASGGATGAGAAAQRQPQPQSSAQRPSRRELADAIRERRNILRDALLARHSPRQPWGVSAADAENAVVALAARVPQPSSRVQLAGATLQAIGEDDLDGLSAQLQQLARDGAWPLDGSDDPWFASPIGSADDVERAKDIVTRLAGGELEQARRDLDEMLAESHLPPATCVEDWRVAVRTMLGVRGTLETFRPEVFDLPLTEQIAATAPRGARQTGETTLGVTARMRARRQARELLRPGRPPADLHAELVSAAEQRASWHRLVGAGGRPEISTRLDEAEELLDQLTADLEWLDARIARHAGSTPLTALPLPKLAELLGALAATRERADVLPVVTGPREALQARGLDELVTDLAARGIPEDQVDAELRHVWWTSLARAVAVTDRAYAGHDGDALRAAADDLDALDADLVATAAAEEVERADAIAAQRISADPDGARLIRQLAVSGRADWALPDLLGASPALLMGIAPIWVAAPHAVAQVVPAGISFDLVLVDGAEGLTAAEAVPALARGRRAVIVGDPDGPAPRSFSTAVRGRRGELLGSTSLLHASAQILPARHLTHVRGVETMLHAVRADWSPTVPTSTVPTPQVTSPVTLERVDGSAPVQPGSDAIESTEAEAERVAELLAADPQDTVVVVLTTAHGQAVRSALSRRGAQAPMLRRVVVAGQEAGRAAHAVISVGFGRTPHGRVLHSFGPVSAPGGERIVADAWSRGTRSIVVVSTLSADELIEERLKTPGAQRLRDLLRIAERGEGAEVDQRPHGVVSRDHDSRGSTTEPIEPIVAYLADRLRSEGVRVATGLGSGSGRVDVAVGDMGRDSPHLVAVLVDTADHARIESTRERERLRAGRLRAAGWAVVRVYGTDLYRDPAREVARVLVALRAAIARRRAEELASRVARLEGGLPQTQAGATDGTGGQPDGDAAASPEADSDDGSERADGGETSEGAGGDDTSESDDGEGAGRLSRLGRALRRKGKDGKTVAAQSDPESFDERPDERGHARWLEEQRPPHWE